MGLASLEKLSSQFWVGEMYNVQENMHGENVSRFVWVVENAYCLRSGFLVLLAL